MLRRVINSDTATYLAHTTPHHRQHHALLESEVVYHYREARMRCRNDQATTNPPRPPTRTDSADNETQFPPFPPCFSYLFFVPLTCFVFFLLFALFFFTQSFLRLRAVLSASKQNDVNKRKKQKKHAKNTTQKHCALPPSHCHLGDKESHPVLIKNHGALPFPDQTRQTTTKKPGAHLVSPSHTYKHTQTTRVNIKKGFKANAMTEKGAVVVSFLTRT